MTVIMTAIFNNAEEVQERQPLHMEGEASASGSTVRMTTTRVKRHCPLAIPSLYDSDASVDVDDDVDDDANVDANADKIKDKSKDHDADADTASISDCSSSSRNNLDSNDIPGSVTLSRSVSWSDTLVTDVRYRPKICCSQEKSALFYSSKDMQQFRQQYKMQVRAAKQWKKEKEIKAKNQDIHINSGSGNDTDSRPQGTVNVGNDTNTANTSCSSDTPSASSVTVTSINEVHHHPNPTHHSPISGLINMMSSYLSKHSSPERKQKDGLSSSSSSSSSSTCATMRNQRLLTETAVLVDTLYLF